MSLFSLWTRMTSSVRLSESKLGQNCTCCGKNLTRNYICVIKHLSVFFFSMDNYKKQQIHLFLNNWPRYHSDFRHIVSKQQHQMKERESVDWLRLSVHSRNTLVSLSTERNEGEGGRGAFSLPSKWTSTYVNLREIQPQWKSLDERLTDPVDGRLSSFI